jgi:hypothetical protein
MYLEGKINHNMISLRMLDNLMNLKYDFIPPLQLKIEMLYL